jgi:capsular polysaccharide export protein
LSNRTTPAAAGSNLRRLFVYNGGFLTQGRVRRILELSGYDIRLGKPGAGELVGVWGQSPTSPRGEAVAAWRGASVLRVEDAFLRSVRPGRDREPPLGLHLDLTGVHFDARQPSDIETLLATHPLDDPTLIARARACIDRLKALHLSKYSAFDTDGPLPAPGFVLVIDQTLGDASVRASGADRARFVEMLHLARREHPDRPIVVKSHPETLAGHRAGHIGPEDLPAGADLWTSATSPWSLLDRAVAVYVVSSQLGFEAILAGHRPVILGQPFYAGWGLSDDRMPVARRGRHLTAEQLFAAAMILYPRWYDPYHDRLCPLEEAIDTLEALTRQWREDRHGWVAAGMRLWKRRPMQSFFGQERPVVFAEGAKAVAARKDGRRLMVWAGKATAEMDQAHAVRVEDGFLRSRGLGAALVPPLSLCLDDLGIYYDPTRESRLERHIAASADLSSENRQRTERLMARLTEAGLSKYNLPSGAPANLGALSDLPPGRRILVPGQVEDDASIRLGAAAVATNRDLLSETRRANPDAVILFKPHPDVEAGLRPGQVADAGAYADLILDRTDPVTALSAVDEVWTITSTIGFEALLRGKKVVCFGSPFYAGWGLTQDRGPALARRMARPDLTALVHACLIQYPRYFDPVTGLPCPVEVVVDRLSRSEIPGPGRINRSLAKLQGAFATYAAWWR